MKMFEETQLASNLASWQGTLPLDRFLLKLILVLATSTHANSTTIPFSPFSIQPNKTLDAGDNPALNRVIVGSTSLVLGGRQSTNLRSGVSNKDRTNSYTAETIKHISTSTSS